MPHDSNGTMIAVGDLVTVQMRVKEISMNEDYCNCTLETVIPMAPSSNHTTVVLNTKQVTK